MAFGVVYLEAALQDIEDIYRFVAATDSDDRAEYVLAGIISAGSSLAQLPQRGNLPKELMALGVSDYREVHWKPYRIFYRIVGRQVVIYCVADGRRDMQSLLRRRLLS